MRIIGLIACVFILLVRPADCLAQPLTVAASVTTTLACFGDDNAVITVTPSGGSSPYSFVWSAGVGGQTSAVVTGLDAGVYTVTVSDNTTATATTTINVTQPPVLSSTVAVTSNYNGEDISCAGGSDGVAMVTPSGGSGGYNFQWHVTAGGVGTAAAAGLSAGTYTVTVTDIKNCEQILQVTLTDPPILAAAASKSGPGCPNSNDGTATGSATGGVSGFTYQWSTGHSSQTISGLSPGTYTVTVTDANGCTDDQDITLVQPTEMNPSVITNNLTCPNSKNGSAFVSVTGGTSPYSYLWFNSSTQTSVNNLSAGSYPVTITDNGGCDTVVQAVITSPPPLNASFTTNDETCFDSNDASASVTAAGGTPPYSYIWSNAATTQSITNVGAGNYTVKIIDINNCDSTFSVSMAQPPNIVTNLTATQITCHGDNDGTASVNPSGGTGTLSVQWSTGSSQNTINNLSEGSYSVTVTDQQGCDTVRQVTITDPEEINPTSSVQDVACHGNSDGVITATPNGGTSPYSYQWSNGGGSAVNNGLPAGSYAVTITDSHGCDTVKSPIEVTEPEELIAQALAVNELCGLPGSLTGSATGGTAPFTYFWGPGMSSQIVSPASKGAYVLTVTDSNGCTDEENAVVDESECETDLVPEIAFTPNGDGINDVWYIQNTHYFPNAEYNVYDRWGQLVHRQRGEYTPWEGRSLGIILPFATYFYVIVKDTNDKGLGTATGSVTIVR